MKDHLYDVVIDAKSFEDLSDSGWHVRLSKESQEQLDDKTKKQLIEELQKPIKDSIKDPKEKEKKLKEIEDKEYTKYDQWTTQYRPVIGVIGERGKGKTFVLSKVADFELPTGHNTKGISVKYVDHSETTRYICLDTAGSSVSLLETTNFSLDTTELDLDKALQKVSVINKDKKMLETFLQNFIIEHSDIIITVVGEMTNSKQFIPGGINGCSNKTLYVVHNLINFETIKQVEDYIEHTLKKLMGCELKEQTFVSYNDEGHNNRTYYTETIKERKTTICHIIFASDKSEETRQYYNEPGIGFLKRILQGMPLTRKVDIIQGVIDNLERTTNNYMKKPKGEKQQNIFYEEVKGNKIIMKNVEIKLKQILTNQIGEVNYLES